MSEAPSGSASADTASASSTVTTVVRRRVRPDRRDDYEAWLRSLHDRARREAPGFQGAEVMAPPAGDSDPTYTSIFRFEDLAARDAFERSDLRREALAEVQPLVAGDATWDTLTGLELWFEVPPGTTVPQPVRWRMAVVLGTVVYVLVLLFGTIAAATLGDVPGPLRLAIVIAVEIVLMTYVLLPRITKLLSGWIYPTSRTA